MRTDLRIPLLLLAAASLAGCFKKASYDTTYVLKPLVQSMSVDPVEPLEGVLAYAYAVDTLAWGVASYEDAAAGILTSKEDPSQRMSPEVVAEPYTDIEGTVGWLRMPIGAPQQTILAVDPASRIYGYTMQEQQLNLSELFVSVVFKPWKEGFSWKDGNWSFYNDFYEPPTVLAAYISPKLQMTQGGDLTDPSASAIKAYAYVADTTLWCVASYDDALAGKITLKEDPTQHRTSPNFQAYREDSGLYGMSVTATPLMVVVVDRTNRLYAYSKQEPDLKGASPTWPVVFRPWREEWITVEEGWRIVDDRLAPETTETEIETTKR